MKFIALAVLCLAGLSSAQDKTARLPAAEATTLRAAYAEALEKHDARSRSTLLALGKKLEGKYAFDDLRDALRKGPLLDASALKPRKVEKKPEEFHRFGTTTVGYTFECDAGVFRYAVDVPSSYDSKQPVAVLLDPGHGSGASKNDEEKAGFVPFYRTQCDRAGFEDWLIVRTEIIEQIGSGGLRGDLPEEQIAAVFQSLWRDIASRFAIDCDRLYATGLSQTGYWSWYLGRASADRYAGIAPMSAVTWQVDAYLANYVNLPMFVLHGDEDKICKVEQPRTTCAKLEELGFAVKYVEVAGSGHDVKTWARLPEALEWLAAKPRAKYARKIAKSYQTLADPWCGWIRVEALEKTGDGKAITRPTATLAAEIEGQVVRITSKGVERATVFLSRELLDLGAPVEVQWNEKSVFSGKLDREFAGMLDVALERVDWTQTFECSKEMLAP